MAALAQARGRDPVDEVEVADLARQVAEAETAVESHSELVELQALPDAEWEAGQTECLDGDGDVDWSRALPLLLAASCVDEDLKDADWWAETLTGEAWTAGDRDMLKMTLLRLNVFAPDPRLPKG
jgi:hypothetical protein